MSKHTPGPWVVATSSNKHNGSGWRDIHSTSGPFAPSYVGEALEDDARLIAAAPDMLSLLKRAYYVMEALDGTSVEGEKLWDDYRAIMAKVAA
jgi:hypothetical protein